MTNESWVEIKESIYPIREKELNSPENKRTAVRFLLPVIELLEKTDVEMRIIKYLSMYNLICKLKHDDLIIASPYIRLMPPGMLYTGTVDEFSLSMIDMSSNGDETELFAERFKISECFVVAERLYKLVQEIVHDASDQ